MNAFMTVYWFATGHKLGGLVVDAKSIQQHNALFEWYDGVVAWKG